jgi:hypothetical protein
MGLARPACRLRSYEGRGAALTEACRAHPMIDGALPREAASSTRATIRRRNAQSRVAKLILSRSPAGVALLIKLVRSHNRPIRTGGCLSRGAACSPYSAWICNMGTKTSGQPIKAARKRAANHPASRAGRTRNPAAHIMAAPKGPRTVSHRRIVEAVEKVFRERDVMHG